MSEILRIYQLAEDALPQRDCIQRACCCQFAQTGREPFVTEAEMQALQEELRRQGRKIPPPRDDGACPLLTDDGMRCSVYSARPLGCRTFFCREAGGPATAREMRDAIQALNALDEKHRRGKAGSRTLTDALASARSGKPTHRRWR
ncbi:MAG: YkgJ family cysteine cluster protein [Myxococcota bacterium]